jgi:hypothetical protein
MYLPLKTYITLLSSPILWEYCKFFPVISFFYDLQLFSLLNFHWNAWSDKISNIQDHLKKFVFFENKVKKK